MIQLPSLRVIPYGEYSGAFNMAADKFLLSLQGPVIRLYGWNSPTLSFGKLNFGEKDIDHDFCSQAGITKVRRPSGGQTVFHQHEITYCFSAENHLFPRSIATSYLEISHPVANALKKIGLQTQMKPLHKKLRQSTICFNEISAYEIEINGKKIVGSAQYRQKKRFLQHGSILLEADFSLWKKIWKLEDSSTILENRVTSIKQELGFAPKMDKLCCTIAEEFIRHFKISGSIKDFDAKEYNQIIFLAQKYSS